jgi:Na+/phosphate symporter
MAVKVYKLSVSSLLFNLLIMLVGLLVIIALAAILGWLISMRQKRKKAEIESRNKKAK